MDDIGAFEASGLADKAPLVYDAYWSLDLWLGWRAHPALELSLTGTNLFDDQHLAFITESYAFPSQVGCAIYEQIKWSSQ